MRGAGIVVLAACLAVVSHVGSAAQVKVTAQGLGEPSSVQFSSTQSADEPVFEVERSAESGSAALLVKEDGHPILSMNNKTVDVADTLRVVGSIIANYGDQDPDNLVNEMDLVRELSILRSKVESLEDIVQSITSHVALPADSGGAIACSQIVADKWAGAGIYSLLVNNIKTTVWCDANKWTLIMRAYNDQSMVNGNPTAYPVVPTGKPPSESSDFNEMGVFRMSTADVALMRAGRKVNDIRVEMRKRVSGSLASQGNVYFPKECVLDFDTTSMLPTGSPCYKSGFSADSASYNFVAGHQDRIVGRWSGPHVNSGASTSGWGSTNGPCFIMHAFHFYPMGAVSGQEYCTWYDSRRCTADSDMTMWIY